MYFGQLAFQQGDVKSAQEAFRKAMELEPRNGKAYLAMADVQRVLKNPSEARRLLEQGFFLDEVDQDLQIQIIVSLLSEGSKGAGGGGDTASLSAAERLTEGMLRSNPESSAAWNVRAEIAFNRNMHEQAVEAYTRCIALDGVGALPHDHLRSATGTGFVPQPTDSLLPGRPGGTATEAK
jgi:predicted Zn-dependent protease